MKTFLNLIIGSSLILVLSTSAFAGALGTLNSFTSGTPAVAADVNDNFTAVKTEVNDNNTRITTNKSEIDTNASDILINANAMPGVEFSSEGTCCSDVTVTSAEYQNVILNAPSSGFAIVSATADCQLVHVNTTDTLAQSIRIALSTTSANTITSSRMSFTLPGSAGSGAHFSTCATQQVFTVTAGVNTFYLNADAVLPRSGESAAIGWINLHAIFVPNRY